MFAFDKRKYSCVCIVCIKVTQSNDVCENNMYVKPWQHTKLNTKGKVSVASFEEMESEETIVSPEGDRVSHLVREGNISIDFKRYICVCVVLK